MHSAPLPESAKAGLDALAVQIIACNRWDKEYPRMNFSGGFSSLTQLTADEKVGKMILLWIIMQTSLGRDIMGLRCNPTFDEQRVTRAARFIGKKMTVMLKNNMIVRKKVTVLKSPHAD